MDRTDCFRIAPDGHGGRATFARYAFRAGEVLYVLRGVATGTRSRDTIEIASGRHVEDGDTRFINHSFSPSIEVRGRELVALRDISPGDEITFNYLASESEIAAPFTCHETGRPVGSPPRRGTAAGDD